MIVSRHSACIITCDRRGWSRIIRAMWRIIGFSSLLAAMVLPAMAEPPKEQPARKQAVELKGNKLLENFDYRDVTLDAGPLRKQVDEARDDYLRIPNDDLLKGFRQRAGPPSPRQGLGRLVYRRHFPRVWPDCFRAVAALRRHG